MPRFYFHFINDMDVPDAEWVELPDLNSAREVARCNARMLVGQIMTVECSRRSGSGTSFRSKGKS